MFLDHFDEIMENAPSSARHVPDIKSFCDCLWLVTQLVETRMLVKSAPRCFMRTLKGVVSHSMTEDRAGPPVASELTESSAAGVIGLCCMRSTKLPFMLCYRGCRTCKDRRA